MSRRGWIWTRLVGWFVLLSWYTVYLANAITPILNSKVIAVSHGITGVTGTILILLGYYYLEKFQRQKPPPNSCQT